MNSLPFIDRRDAGKRLGSALVGSLRTQEGGRIPPPDILVLALPRGGVEVGFEVARALAAPLDVFVVRKIGVPGHEELAMGAIGSGDVRVTNPLVVRSLGITRAVLEDAMDREVAELHRREDVYRGNRSPPDVRGRHVVLVDDGVSTGATLRAALTGLRQLHPARITVAVPVAPRDSIRLLREEADDVVCLATPEPFGAVGRWYQHFDQTADTAVTTLLAHARAATASREQEAGQEETDWHRHG